jgi:hypothetical protein
MSLKRQAICVFSIVLLSHFLTLSTFATDYSEVLLLLQATRFALRDRSGLPVGLYPNLVFSLLLPLGHHLHRSLPSSKLLQDAAMLFLRDPKFFSPPHLVLALPR